MYSMKIEKYSIMHACFSEQFHLSPSYIYILSIIFNIHTSIMYKTINVVWPHVIINYDSHTGKMFHAENGYSLILTLQHVKY